MQDPANPVPPNLPNQPASAGLPSHVPPELVVTQWPLNTQEFLAAPYQFMADMHNNYPPVYYGLDPVRSSWGLLKHADCLHVLRNADTFRNLEAVPFPRDKENYFFFIPQEIDPPHHRKYRNIVDPLFSPAGIKKLEGKIRGRVNELIDQFIDDGECEFTLAFGRTLPVSIFLDIMGLPQDMLFTFASWGDEMIHGGSPEVSGAALAKAVEYLTGAIEEKKRNPDDGVISLIAHAEIDGRKISDKEAFGFVCFLFLGGLDTVYATLNNIWAWLAQNPDRVQEIIDRPDTDIDKIIEELLRRFSVVQASTRFVMKDIEIGGVQIKAGDRVNTLLPVANFDPDVFPDPLTVDFDRPRKTTLAFTVGVHSCMGGHLARMEVKTALQEWLRRIPKFSIKPGEKIEYKAGGVIGPDKVPLVW
ncbi:cytochrome P450 [Novosphingobium malaysiense]|uniref:Cytochrome P450 n=1 Tax=Novosphingobium malaysiense TaxID=1348853 RepID=A0A0B1ZMJ4_9SPHN|nr:cytochrome P450 [Novosphingobium malaysiense]